MAKRIDLSGMYPPICTPFTASGDLDVNSLRANLKKWIRLPLRGVVVMGSNGEAVHLTAEERITLVKESVAVVKSESKELGKDFLVIAGAGGQSTREAVQSVKSVAAAGADVALVITPFFFPTSPAGLEAHFRAVADASPIPIVLYNVPKFTHVDIPTDVIIRLSKHKNIIGLKDSGGNITAISRVCYYTKDNNFQVLVGSAGFLLPGLVVGCVGGVCALANIAGEECAQVITLFLQGKLDEAKKLQGRLVDPNTAVTATYGVSGLKYTLELLGFYGGPVRAPLVELKSDEKEKLTNILSQAKLLPKQHSKL